MIHDVRDCEAPRSEGGVSRQERDQDILWHIGPLVWYPQTSTDWMTDLFESHRE